MKPGTKLRLRGLGFPAVKAGQSPGDLYAVIQLAVPAELSSEQRGAAEELRRQGL